VEEYFVYILQCADSTYYIGITDNVEDRVSEHQEGLIRNSYTHGRRPVGLVWSEGFELRTDAFELERKLKGWSHAKKEAFIRGDWAAVQMLARNRERQRNNPAR
jgi:putative endonuclease